MTNLIPLINSNLTPEMQGTLYFLSLEAHRNSQHIYCAGGFLLDLLLGRENRQLDLIVVGSAVNFAQKLTGLLPGKLSVYEKLETATLILPKGFVFTMASARAEFNPFIMESKTSAEDNLLKKNLFERDFTIDTLACSLNKENFGQLYDFFGGLADLGEKSLKVLYQLSLVDKPLRILRLIRLEQRLGFSLGKETGNLLRQGIAHRILGRASRESLYREVRRLFREPSPIKIILRLAELGLFKQLFPRIELNAGLVHRLKHLEGFLHQVEKENAMRTSDILLTYLSLLFSELSEHDLHYMCHIMRLKRRERQEIQRILKNKATIPHGEILFASI